MGQVYWVLDMWDGADFMGSICFRKHQRKTAESLAAKLEQLGYAPRN